MHSTAFRRLVYKTQVFLNHEGDLFRTRLTHSLEVAQLGRSIARSLRINEDLVEAISLAHDLGHTPFGHAGQDALHGCMAEHGGFEHNLQSLRVVDKLEERYPQYDGLNLTFETREGVLKHCSRQHAQQLEREEPGGVGARFLRREQPSLEAQLCNLADEIAYNAHDIDDGVRSGLITLAQLQDVPLFDQYRAAAQAEYPDLVQPLLQRRLLFEAIRRMLSAQVYDVIDATQAALARHAPTDVQAVRQSPSLVMFGDAMRARSLELKQFLFKNLYRHPRVMETTGRAQEVVRDVDVGELRGRANPRDAPVHCDYGSITEHPEWALPCRGIGRAQLADVRPADDAHEPTTCRITRSSSAAVSTCTCALPRTRSIPATTTVRTSAGAAA